MTKPLNRNHFEIVVNQCKGDLPNPDAIDIEIRK